MSPRIANSGSFKKGIIPWSATHPASNETKKKISDALKGRKAWNKGIPMSKENKEKDRLSHLGKHHTIEVRKRQSERAKQLGTGFKKGNTAGHFHRHFTAMHRQKLSESKKRWYSNPENAKKAMTILSAKLGIKPTQAEKYLDAVLQLNFPHNWKYTGDFALWIEGKNPDFVECNGKKLIIEYNGFYTHTPKKDEEKAEHYSKYGFKTLNLYPIDLKNEKLLIEKIKAFMQDAKIPSSDVNVR